MLLLLFEAVRSSVELSFRRLVCVAPLKWEAGQCMASISQVACRLTPPGSEWDLAPPSSRQWYPSWWSLCPSCICQGAKRPLSFLLLLRYFQLPPDQLLFWKRPCLSIGSEFAGFCVHPPLVAFIWAPPASFRSEPYSFQRNCSVSGLGTKSLFWNLCVWISFFENHLLLGEPSL